MIRIVVLLLAMQVPLGCLAQNNPTLSPATFEGSWSFQSSQTTDGENELAILFSNFVVNSRPRKWMCGQCNSRSLRVTVPLKASTPSVLKIDIRGSLQTDDKTAASCSLWINDKALTTWGAAVSDGEVFLETQEQVEVGTSLAILNVGIACATSTKKAQAQAALDSIDIAVESAVLRLP